MVCPSCDKCEGFPRYFGAEQNVSETFDRHAYRTERWKNRCVYVQDENKHNDGGNGNIRENGSVVTIQHPNRLLLCNLYKLYQYCTKNQV